MLEVVRETAGECRLLVVVGELDLATTPVLSQAVTEELASGNAPAQLVIDLTDTTFMDSSGARELVLAARQAKAGGTGLQVLCPVENRRVRRVLDLLQMDKVVPVRDALAETYAQPVRGSGGDA